MTMGASAGEITWPVVSSVPDVMYPLVSSGIGRSDSMVRTIIVPLLFKFESWLLDV